MNQKYETIIGLEIHVQLKTASKMFCSCRNVQGDASPNSAVCPVCLGHPGTLPVVNREALKQAIRLALALNCTIAEITRFDRKNYFYPDLPKGYQISQLDMPLALGGYVAVGSQSAEHGIHLERLHVEEDAGKNFHVRDETLVDFNRAGTPLAEIVTKADLRSPEEARIFLQELRLIARTTGVSDADMEKGQLRCDANISVRPIGNPKLYPKTEIKNLNSFRSVERALQYEEARQVALWEAGKHPMKQETRGWDEEAGETRAQRTKEGSDDYRYFPEPDLLPIQFSSADIAGLRASVPELPGAKRHRFMKEYGLTYAEAQLLVERSGEANYFEAVVSELREWFVEAHAAEKNHEAAWQTDGPRLVKHAYSWITTELFKHLNADRKNISVIKISPEDMAEFVLMVADARLNSSAAQTILEKMYHEGRDPHDIAEREKLYQQTDENEIRLLVSAVIEQFPDQVSQYRGGKENVLQFLVGHVMRLSGGRAHPELAKKILREELRK